LKVAIRGLIAAIALLASVAVVGLLSAGDAGSKGMPANEVLAKAVAVELGGAKLHPKSPFARVSGGTVNATLERMGVIQKRLARAARTRNGKARFRNANNDGDAFAVWRPSKGCSNVFGGDDDDDDGDGRGGVDNIRVNQDCTLRRQAEEWIAVNPRDFDNLVAGQNDSMVGFNHCGYDFSFNRGDSWASVGTQPPPFYQELFQTGDTADACSDPAGSFDHLGNAYVTGVFFDVADFESTIWVAKSNWPNGGAFYHEPRQSAFQEYSTAVMGEPASDADPDIFHDKELMVADSRPNSPKKGRVYVTWTRFETTATPVGGRSPILFSQSKDGGATWSRAVIISGAAGSFCTVFSGTPDNPNACDQDQGSHPVVGPDGTIYVVFGNGNTPEAGINQVLMVRCPPTKDCETETDWEGPFLVGQLIGTHPIGDPGNAGGCPVGRQCLPPNGYRAPEFTGMSISVDRNSNLYIAWWDTRNHSANCGPIPWSTASPPCNSDVFYAFSTNRGTTWSDTRNVTTRFAPTAQWQSWHDVSGDGKKLYIAYYDRHYGNCEFTGCNDITLTTVHNPRSARPSIRHRRITTSSMPNLVPANNPVQAGFLGDYMWVEVSHHNFNQKDVHIVWADTRPLPYRLSHQRAPEEDIYYARIDDDEDDDDDD
jgi:hypothetical protein